ncbi:MAG: protein phosphatase CheZ [Alphaproteobacteria bacterium]|nr:protein phosphatase CheZ [Alphaproteobacteria bacterium]
MVENTKKVSNQVFASRQEIEDFVDSILYSHIPGHEGGTNLKIGQLSNRMTVGDLEKRILNNVRSTFTEKIKGLHPEDIRDKYIPNIINELVAIRSSTETATSAILECAEHMDAITENIPEETRDAIQKYTTRILEASSFQDITGQRMGKVIRTLEQIEMTLDGILSLLGDEDAKNRYKERVSKQQIIKDPGEMLEGPDLHQSPDKQQMIDEMFQ